MIRPIPDNPLCLQFSYLQLNIYAAFLSQVISEQFLTVNLVEEFTKYWQKSVKSIAYKEGIFVLYKQEFFMAEMEDGNEQDTNYRR